VIWSLLQWLLLLTLLFYVSSVLLSFIPFVLLTLTVVVTLCCIYALLPPAWRLPTIEMWLYPDWEPEVKEPSFPPSQPTNPSNPPHNNSSMSQFQQPPLDFENLTFNTRGYLPNREQLLNLLNSQVIGQKLAIETLVRLVMGKLAAQNFSKPLVIFLPGSTGTGKTELSKALASALGTKLHRFDMGEYADSFKSSNLMGSSKGYVGSEEGGALLNALRQSKKTCVLLFDEVEKANPGLWRQMLAFFDEGILTDTLGSITAPKNTICLLTSNLVAEKIAQNPDAAKDILRDAGFFPPEFIGRIDKVIPLLRLNQADSAYLTVVLAKKVANRYGINLVIGQEVMETLVQETFEEGEKYGGRGIQEKILDLLSDDLLDLQAQRTKEAQLVTIKGRLKAQTLEWIEGDKSD
jgi:ATP-dependent Clp protease ATP-binding subunit ClpA